MQAQDPDSHKQRVAAVMQRAIEIYGSKQHLAEALGVSVVVLDQWVHRQADCPSEHFSAATKVILDRLDELEADGKPSSG